jgi:hypothetical protein
MSILMTNGINVLVIADVVNYDLSSCYVMKVTASAIESYEHDYSQSILILLVPCLQLVMEVSCKV